MNRPLRAGVNAIFLEPGMGGLETYVLELVPALLRVDPALRLTVLVQRARPRAAGAAAVGDVGRAPTPLATPPRPARRLYELARSARWRAGASTCCTRPR